MAFTVGACAPEEVGNLPGTGGSTSFGSGGAVSTGSGGSASGSGGAVSPATGGAGPLGTGGARHRWGGSGGSGPGTRGSATTEPLQRGWAQELSQFLKPGIAVGDSTHFSEVGATGLSQLVTQNLKTGTLPLRDYIK